MTRLTFACRECAIGTVEVGIPHSFEHGTVVLATCLECQHEFPVTLTRVPEQGILALGG